MTERLIWQSKNVSFRPLSAWERKAFKITHILGHYLRAGMDAYAECHTHTCKNKQLRPTKNDDISAVLGCRKRGNEHCLFEVITHYAQDNELILGDMHFEVFVGQH